MLITEDLTLGQMVIFYSFSLLTPQRKNCPCQDLETPTSTPFGDTSPRSSLRAPEAWHPGPETPNERPPNAWTMGAELLGSLIIKKCPKHPRATRMHNPSSHFGEMLTQEMRNSQHESPA
jgi:hypothetical protein